ncbi:hypothetical protein GIB67_010265 [Kingdonia uniflora]|uniref:Peptidase M20 dimerisation domain-containing protein n=1 Tax=Kingdonia uniflora TaxID=39325 RepID=A0A7J7NAX2_9MAGN|nr:hypothetical protein GIB67_010265 [Kingdonia uniflora]
MLYIEKGCRTGVASKPYHIIWRYGENAYELGIPGTQSHVVNVKLLTQFNSDIPAHPVTPAPDVAMTSEIDEILDSCLDAGTIVLVFQPAEEGGGGAKRIVDASALKNVDAIFGLHVSTNIPVGTVASRSGPLLAANGFFEAVISGKGGHAAIPQHAIDPILAASNVIVSLQHIVSREVDPLDSQVVTVAKFQGGGAFNVIPDSVTIGGTFRAFSKESFMQLKQRIEEVIKRQAAVQRCNATVDFFQDKMPFFPVTVNNEDLHKHFLNVAGDMLRTPNVQDSQPLMGSEDFSFYSEVIPGYFYFLGMKNESRGELESGHSPYFTINEDALPYGAALQASLAARYIHELQPQPHITEENVRDEL